MRIAQFVPSPGGLYCENCRRDMHLYRALKEIGHETMAVPMYLPLPEEVGGPDDMPIFFGGIRAWLAGQHGIFKRLPKWLVSVVDSQLLLGMAAKQAGMTKADDVVDTTISMLRGEEGHQAEQLEEMVEWLAARERPDISVICSPLLAGVAGRIRERLGSLVVTFLQDEHQWVDAMSEPGRTRVWDLIRERTYEMDGLVAVSEFYRDLMAPKLGVAREQIDVVRPGIDVKAYEGADPRPEGPTIGYLAPLRPEAGIIDLLRAVAWIGRRGHPAGLKLRIAGRGIVPKWCVREVHRETARLKLRPVVEFVAEPKTPAEKRTFFESLSVHSAPSRVPEAFGFHVVESLASGVPVVHYAHGAAVELIEITGGGLLAKPGDGTSLAEALERVLFDKELAFDLAHKGREAAHREFSSERMARELASVFQRLIARHDGRPETRHGILHAHRRDVSPALQMAV